MMKYSFKCPSCSYVAVVDADNDDVAVGKLMAEVKMHAESAHPNLEITDEQMEEMVRNGMERTVV